MAHSAVPTMSRNTPMMTSPIMTRKNMISLILLNKCRGYTSTQQTKHAVITVSTLIMTGLMLLTPPPMIMMSLGFLSPPPAATLPPPLLEINSPDPTPNQSSSPPKVPSSTP